MENLWNIDLGGIGHGWWPLFGIHDFHVCDFVLDLIRYLELVFSIAGYKSCRVHVGFDSGKEIRCLICFNFALRLDKKFPDKEFG